jgi:hypothetical protein
LEGPEQKGRPHIIYGLIFVESPERIYRERGGLYFVNTRKGGKTLRDDLRQAPSLQAGILAMMGK